ncbi:MAG: hypothetical protein WBN88_10630 [Anderseniella sp.]
MILQPEITKARPVCTVAAGRMRCTICGGRKILTIISPIKTGQCR